MVPTVGRTVHYTSPGETNVPFAAIITAVKKGKEGIVVNEECNYDVSLLVIFPNGFSFMEKVEYSREPMKGYWSWPPIAVGVKI